MDKDNNKSKKSRLTSEDIALWKRMTEDVTPFSDDPYDESNTPQEPSKPHAIVKQTAPSGMTAPTQTENRQGQDLDQRTAQRLRRGEIRPQARLDLHGLSREKAYAALSPFIQRAHARGLRCILVITGKGRTGKKASDSVWLEPEEIGILRREVPQWLAEAHLRPYVLRTEKAQPKDGGEGALYVLIRRQRNA